MQVMISICYKLKEIIGIDKLNTSKVINMSGMFQACYIIEYIDLSNFNTHNVTDMDAMFNKCHKLKEIKRINNFDLYNVKNKNNIFNECNNLNQIILFNFNIKIFKNKYNKINFFIF